MISKESRFGLWLTENEIDYDNQYHVGRAAKIFEARIPAYQHDPEEQEYITKSKMLAEKEEMKQNMGHVMRQVITKMKKDLPELP